MLGFSELATCSQVLASRLCYCDCHTRRPELQNYTALHDSLRLSDIFKHHSIITCTGAVALGAGAAVLLKPKLVQKLNASDAAEADEEEEHLLVNWSGTHECRPRMLAQPESLEELEALVADAHAAGAQS